MKDKISVGVVGCGYWGPNLIRNLRGLPGCELKVMCDVSEERLRQMRKLYPEVAVEQEFGNLLNGSNLDAVVIATSVSHHYRMAKASLLAGKHTFVEKPLARSVAECEELVELAQKQGLVLMVGHTFLYSAPVQMLRDYVKKDEIGDLLYISSCRSNLGLFQKDINVAWDLAPHDLSIILYILEQLPVSVNCQGNAHVTEGIEDVINMALDFGYGRSAFIHNSWLAPKKVRQMTLVGTKKMIVYDDVEPLEKISIYDARVEAPPHYDNFADWQYAYHHGDRFVPHIKHEEPLKVECRHFLDCIEQGLTPISDGRKGLEVVKILEAACASLKDDGGAVRLSEPAPQRLAEVLQPA